MTNTSELSRTVETVLQANASVNRLILDYALLMAIIMTPPPWPWVFEFQLGALLIVNLLLIRQIGQNWGFPRGQGTLAVLMLVLGVLGAFILFISVWSIGFAISLFVPPLRCLGRVVAGLALTIAIGRTFNDYYLSARRLDPKRLRQIARAREKRQAKLSKVATQASSEGEAS